MADSYDGFMSYSHAADDLLAPRLQAGLQRFAKPWWKRRALRMFRDEASLSANPHLWSSITAALDDSEWFVLLLSEEAAASEWVNREVEYWLEHKDPSRILPVVTDGEFSWVDGGVSGSAAPEALSGAFAEEPRWVDLRWARTDVHLDLNNPRFSDAVADIASAIRGIPKDELASEEVKQHRRTVRTAWAAGIVVLLLGIAATVGAIVAVGQSNEAEDQRDEAQRQAAIAEENEHRAEDAEADALNQAALARSRELAAASISVLSSDPELSILLALQSAVGLDAASLPIESMVALRSAIYADNLISRIPIPDDESVSSGGFSPDGTLLAWASADSLTLRILDTSSGAEVWSYEVPQSSDCLIGADFSDDGSEVMLLVMDSSPGFFACPLEDHPDDGEPARLIVFDAPTGAELRRYERPGCEFLVAERPSPDGKYVPLAVQTPPDCTFRNWTVQLSDPVDFTPLLEIDFFGPPAFSWSADGSRLVIQSMFGAGSFVYDLPSSEPVLHIPDVYFSAADPAGSMVASGDFETPVVLLHDLETGQLVDRLTGISDSGPWTLEFLPDGRRLVAGTSGEVSAVWDITTGQVDTFLRQAGPVFGMRYVADRDELLLLGGDSFSRWDLSGLTIGETVPQLLSGPVFEDSIITNGRVGLVMTNDEQVDLISVFDPQTGEVGEATMPGSLAWIPAVLPDGRVVLPLIEIVDDRELVGPLVVWDPATDEIEPLVGCAMYWDERTLVGVGQQTGPCADGRGDYFDFERIHLSPSGDELLVTSSFSDLLVFDAHSLDLVAEHKMDVVGGVRAYGGEWIVVSSSPTGLTAGQEDLSVILLPSLESGIRIEARKVAVNRDASLIAVDTDAGTFTIFDTDTWTEVVSSGLGEGRILSLDFSPDGSRLMTSGTDNFVRVWDTGTGVELERIPVPDPVDGYWIDGDRLVVGTADGLWARFSLDRNEVLQLAGDRLSRGFTSDECETYQIDPCPSFEEVRNRG